MTPDQQRGRLEYLLSLPALWADEVAELKALANSMNVLVRFEHLDATRPGSGWQPGERPQPDKETP